MIKSVGSYFKLDTAHTSYIFRVHPTGYLEHLYYGEHIDASSEEELMALNAQWAFPPGNTNVYDENNISLDSLCLEYSGIGKSDNKEPFIDLTFHDGTSTTDFVFEYATINDQQKPLKTLPSSYDNHEHLFIRLRDRNHHVELELHYYVYSKEDVITRCTRLINHDEPLTINRLMSLQLDFYDDDYIMTTFNGGWADEMQRHDHILNGAKVVNSSNYGVTSSRANNFIMLSKKETNEFNGDAYGFHLLYSGNHKEVGTVNAYHQTHLITGINDETFSFRLDHDEIFEAPEAVMTYSAQGFHTMSENLYSFINHHIVRGSYANKIRPILLNSWEAYYFNISEAKLLKLGKAAKNVGAELLVMDDGWFGRRDDDTSSLGDWYINKKKFPKGLNHLVQEINKLGLSFGLWIEPEMVSVNSELYQKHPDWTLDIDQQSHSEGRHQRLLDLCNDDVVDHLIETISSLLSSANIKYVKWDMNRTFTDYYSRALPKERQKEVVHRYVLGFYRLAAALTKKFPDILFEGCASGGNRFDLGMLCYFPQIWASDNTDAYRRSLMQINYSYGYPQSCYTNHVSAVPNHQTLRTIDLDSRFHVAMLGILGYECNLCDMSKDELKVIREQISLYKKYRETLQYGTYYRDRQTVTIVSRDRSEAAGVMITGINDSRGLLRYQAHGLNNQKYYHFKSVPHTYRINVFGDLINTASPVHIKVGSPLYQLASKVITLRDAQEDYHLSGSLLNKAGVMLKQSYNGTGFNDQMRLNRDFTFHLYLMDEEKEPDH